MYSKYYMYVSEIEYRKIISRKLEMQISPHILTVIVIYPSISTFKAYIEVQGRKI